MLQKYEIIWNRVQSEEIFVMAEKEMLFSSFDSLIVDAMDTW